MAQTDVAALEKVVTAWDDAINSADVDATLALYVDDEPKAMPPNAPLATGKAAIRKVIEGLHAQGKLTVHDQFVGAEVSGDTATIHGTFKLNSVTTAGEAIEDVGKWICLCRREADGSWKVIYNMWNSDNPLPAS